MIDPEKKHLLLVEDNMADAVLFKEILLDKYDKLELAWVADGQEALEYVSNKNMYENARRPDIIMLDLGLPRVSGYEVLKEIKANDDIRSIPVIIFTTSRNRADEQECLGLGAEMMISKPHNLDGYEELTSNLINHVFPRLMHSSAA